MVDTAEAKLGERPRGGGDRRAPFLGPHARVSRATVETKFEHASVWRAEHDLADRRPLVVDIAGLGDESRVVEGVSAAKRDLLLRREEQLDPRMRAPFVEDPPRRLEHDGDCCFVVGTEDRPAGVADDALFDDGLDGGFNRHRVRVSAEEDRRASPVRRGQPAVDVPRVSVETRRATVFVPLEPELREVGADAVCNGPFLPRRARDRAELEEELEERRAERFLHEAHPTGG